MAYDNNILQLSFFDTCDTRQANYTDLFDLAPRYTQRAERKKDSTFLDGLYREFVSNNEKYGLSISPARIRDPSTGTERDELPGEREQLVEDVIRKMASDKMSVGSQDQLITTFTINGICSELQKYRHTFSKMEVKEALQILHRSVVEIVKVVEPGERKPKALVSASVFPALVMKDENDLSSEAYVQLNPLLAQAIKSLAFQQVNYDWMMRVRGQLTRWVFKSISLMLSDRVAPADVMVIKASDIAGNFGTQWSRWRDMLAQVNKTIVQLKDVGMIDDFHADDVKEGRTRTDVIYTLRLSRGFLDDRMKAREVSRSMRESAKQLTGTERPDKFVPISGEVAASIRMDRRKEALAGAD